MTAAKPGDRVRVTFVGDYYGQTSSGRHRILTPCNESFAPSDAVVEVLAPPVKVGDAITSSDQLNRLGDGSVVMARLGAVAQKHDGKWRGMAGSGELDPATVACWRATVLHVGEVTA